MEKVFIIGGMKCGTSSLYQMFKDVDAVCLSKFKEPSFFTKRFTNGVDWYKCQFEPTDSAKFLMDVSPSYSKEHLFPGCAKRIHDYDADAKIIYIVRDPLDRVISNIFHDLLRGRLTTKEIEKVLISNENYIQTSNYMFQIRPYVDLFGEKNVLVLQFEDLKNNLPAFNKKIADFLEIDFSTTNVKAQNVSENRFLIKYFDFVHSRFGYGFIAKCYYAFWRLVNIKIEKPKLSEASLQLVYDKLNNDISEFIEKFKIDESSWKEWQTLKNK
jgi:hypothetical protein